MRRAAALAAAVMLLQGCVMNDRFRYVQNQPGCFDPPPDPVPGKPGETRPFPSIDCGSALYKTGFIEFDEDGKPIDADQASKVLKLIESEKKRAEALDQQRLSAAGKSGRPDGKVITLVYVHGWKNNARQVPPGHKPQDVERFSTALAELGHRARVVSPQNPVPIVGVYIAWKGKSLRGPGAFTWLSYWGRRNVANRIGHVSNRAGGDPLAGVLNAIIELTNKDSTQSRVMLVGHSFGARVLEHAIEQGGVTLFDPAFREVVAPRVDLVLYVNSANDARLSVRGVEAFRRNPVKVRHPDYSEEKCRAATNPRDPTCREYPLLVTVMSAGDLATKYVLRVANRINLDKNSAPEAPPVSPAPGKTFIDAVPRTGDYTRRSAGHMRFMQSHDVSEMECPSRITTRPVCPPTDRNCAFAFRTLGECAACFRADTRVGDARTEVFNSTPHWIMNVDTRISKDHGDIWNQSLLSMLGELMAPRGFFDPATGRMQLRGQ